MAGEIISKDGEAAVNIGATNPLAKVSATMDVALATIVDDTTDVALTYICEAMPGSLSSAAVWRCCRLTIASGVIEWADGDGKFDNIADNRAALSYS